jgi:hypothetical protein
LCRQGLVLGRRGVGARRGGWAATDHGWVCAWRKAATGGAWGLALRGRAWGDIRSERSPEGAVLEGGEEGVHLGEGGAVGGLEFVDGGGAAGEGLLEWERHV